MNRRFVFFLSLLVACGGSKGQPTLKVGPQGTETPESTPQVAADTGLTFHLEQGAKPAESSQRARIVDGSPLSEREANALFAGLPALPREVDEAVAFAKRPAGKPPATAVKVIDQPFPAKASATKSTPARAKALEVVRHAPEGAVELARELSVTFSEPMVPLTSHAQSTEKGVPVKLEPMPQGRFRWVGTQTLLYTAEPRFPFSTQVSVRVPAGTKALSGAALGKELAFRFRTPTLDIVESSPRDDVPSSRTPLVYVQFNQRVNADAALSALVLDAGGEKIALRKATSEEIASDREFAEKPAELAALGIADHAVFGKPVKTLPAKATISLQLPQGSAFGEGPLGTPAPIARSFKTHGAFAALRASCDPQRACRPGEGVGIELTNPIDDTRFDPASIRVEPAIAGLEIVPSGPFIHLSGETEAAREYRVTLDASLRDVFGQALGEQRELTFRVGDALPELQNFPPLVVLDPTRDGGALRVESLNVSELAVRVYAVEPKDWYAAAALREQTNAEKPVPPGPGREVSSFTLKLDDKRNQRVTSRIDLGKALTNGLGHALVIIEPRPQRGKDFWLGPIVTWVESTKLGLDAFVDARQLVAWVTSLADGKAQEDVEVSLLPEDVRGRSDADGVARLELPKQQGARGRLLVARRGADIALLPEQPWAGVGGGPSGWQNSVSSGSSLRAHVFDDRGIYRPGESVHVKGWVRRVWDREPGEPKLPEGPHSLRYEVTSALGERIGEGALTLNDQAGFDFAFALPKNVHLGQATIHFHKKKGEGESESESFYHTFSIEEYRRPEYEVHISSEAPAHFVGTPIDLSAKASYHAGGPLAEAKVSWTVSATQSNFDPPGHEGFTFGEQPFWFESRLPMHGESKEETLLGRTDGNGAHALRIVPERVQPAFAQQLSVSASVEDLSRQNWSDHTTLVVHPADVYVGLRVARSFTSAGEAVPVEAIVVDLDGKPVQGRPVRIALLELSGRFERGTYQASEREVAGCTITSSGDVSRCELRAEHGGMYRVAARVTDARGRPNDTRIRHWISGGTPGAIVGLESDHVEIVPDKREYAPGDVAKLLIRAPFSPADALVRLEHGGIVELKHVHLDGAQTVEFPVREDYVPNVIATVEVVGRKSAKGQDGDAPAYAEGQLDMPVSIAARRLAVEIEPSKRELAPGQKAELALRVRDARGKQVARADVALVVVDEAILQLMAREELDPLEIMHPRLGSLQQTLLMRQWMLGPAPDERQAGGGLTKARRTLMRGAMALAPQAAEASDVLMDQAQGGGAAQGTLLRRDFEPLALFAGSVRTGADGTARVPVTMRDTLTRYRVLAVAAHGDHEFGKGESTMTVKKALMLRPAPPRFANLGDAFSLPVLVQNEGDSPLDVNLAMRGVNLTLEGATGKRVSVPARDRVEVRFAARSKLPGTLRVQIAGSAGALRDATELELPVWTPATDEAFATYGDVADDGAIAQSLRVPERVASAWGGLSVSLSSTQLAALTDAFVAITESPYDLPEQSASRILAIVSMRDVLATFHAEGLPDAAELERVVYRDLARLASIQGYDGGFGYYEYRERSEPFVSVHVSHALARAKEAGFGVPPALVQNLRNYVLNLAQHPLEELAQDTRASLLAYAAYSELLWGNERAGLAERAYAQGAKTNVEALGWLLPVFHARGEPTRVAEIVRTLHNRVTETAAAAHFAERYSDGMQVLAHSSLRADAVVLEGLLRASAEGELGVKLVRGLLAHRTKGRWEGTQENVFALLALRGYFERYEREEPSFTARAFVGRTLAADKRFSGRSTEQAYTEVPMAWLETHASEQLLIEKRGKGRLYYRLGLTYAPSDFVLPPADHGFAVERSYEPVDHPSDVRRDEQGRFHVRAGARVRVSLSMAAFAQRDHVALVDPLPAGLEPINPALAVSESLPNDGRGGGPVVPLFRGDSWWPTWFGHQNLRDDRVEAHATRLGAGVYTYTYYARATTPGSFIAPPTKAEELYAPETFGRSATHQVIVE